MLLQEKKEERSDGATKKET